MGMLVLRTGDLRNVRRTRAGLKGRDLVSDLEEESLRLVGKGTAHKN